MSRNEEFKELRPLLFSIAHRFLGSRAAAEDAVHEAWLRYEAALTPPVPGKAFLSAEVTRISAGLLRSARVQPDTYAGPRPFEPLMSGAGQDPDQPVEPAQSLSAMAVLLLERLSPLERAVFVLREVFGCDLSQIASVVGCSEAACDQLAAAVSRAGGGRALRWPRLIVGADHVARVLAAMAPALVRIGVTMEPQQVHHGPGAVFRDRHGTILSALAFDLLDGQVHTIRWVTRPSAPRGPAAHAPGAV
ncbi:sigma factor-like helix-turn-helix DNA-binding protein [Streptomyces sp. DG2A-72]|uniref:sigma factor-like helix-turn-helix DNA-binding protein n=1 Tax=Streptomyces sp. DG2A-72 TaxID=3051386 RepID=UPI00265C75A1|nr:sigma factor-like helix-turn-helix DNA-binding protein [Streptomyces sp. DG2A-72]MDO0939411.1 sigma factor-like helix-turn-helix DNA-binding protein [Streptomyces sp. DG2A-72]